jgi:hypothetical protein
LEVFCISNPTYEKFSQKGNADMVRASGIPELRRFCHTITAGAQLLEAKHFLKSTLSSLLNSIELWASSSPARPEVEDSKPDESVYEILEDVEVKVHSSPPSKIFPLCQANQQKVSEDIGKSEKGFSSAFRELLLEFLGMFWL